jgi:sulfatase modifying factor 1
MPRLCSSLLLSLLIASAASAVSTDWTFVGNPGNACGNTAYGCYGAVDHGYAIATYEVTNAQYAEFLNAKAKSDPLGLFNPNMADPTNYFAPSCNCPSYENHGLGGITRSGTDGSYTYSAIAGRDNMPVNYVSYFDALRFANWMNNAQGNSDTETGAYTLLGGTATPSNGNDLNLPRNAGAQIFLPTENEWFKAAYYDPATTSYLDYPTGSDAICSNPTSAPAHANCGNGFHGLTAIGSYPGSPSRYGTFDQGGNVFEWNQGGYYAQGIAGGGRPARGGSYADSAGAMSNDNGWTPGGTLEDNIIGFRLAAIPEPSTGLLVIAGLLGLGVRRRISV